MTSWSPTPSCASGAGSTRRAPSPARPSASRRRSCCSATTTTAATRRGSAGPTARTTSSRARRSSRLSQRDRAAGDGPRIVAMARDRIPTSRVARTAKIGSLAAGQAVRQAGTRAANVDALQRRRAGRARTPPPRGGRADRHRARDDEGRGDEARAGAVVPRRRARAGGASRGVPGEARRAARRGAEGRFKDMRKVIEAGARRPARRAVRDVRPGADRRRLDRPGLPRDAARRARRRGQGPVPGRRRRRARGHVEPRADHARRQADDAGPRREGRHRGDPPADRRGARLRAGGAEPALARAHLPRPPVHRRARTS